MATVPFDVPDELVSDLVAALALRQGVERPTEAPAMIALAQSFIGEQFAGALLDHKGMLAALAAREDLTDPGVVWAHSFRDEPEVEAESAMERSP